MSAGPDLTTPYTPAEPPTATAPLRRPVDVVAASAADAGAELLGLVRSRLRQLFVLFLVVYAMFLLRDAVIPHRDSVRFQQVILFAAAVIQAGLIGLSRSRWFDRPAVVRAAEWANLAVFAAQQGANQFLSLIDPATKRAFADPTAADIGILVANTWLMPWMVLASAYPVVVPNPWRRTLAVAVFLVLAPAAVTVLATAASDNLTAGETATMYPQFLIWGAVAVGIAVYGAAQAGALRREAFEARQFGQYRLLKKLGAGGMGEVYLAEHQLLRRPSVIKLIRPDRAADPRMVRRFEREVRRLATLTHWNTVQVFDYGHTPDGTFYYVMEYLPGLNLEQVVEQHGPLPAGRAVYLLRQVCRGLREAHAAGLIHRDVKPSNVMVCRRGGLADVAKLLDFGLVSAAGDDPEDARLTGAGVVLGTPAYLSPEQACGRPVDVRGDVYSLGATAYYLLTGKPPFDRPRAMEIIAAHIHEPVTPPSACEPSVPADLCAAVVRCLAKDPADRFPGVRELEAALAACGCAAEWDEDKAEAWWREHAAG